MEVEYILELQNVSKTFGDLVAVDNIDFQLQAGKIHAILGENGAGKSTLMNLIYGLYQPSNGKIIISGKTKQLKSPRDAIVNGIGMVHQHFMLIENLTVAENIALTVSQFYQKKQKTDSNHTGTFPSSIHNFIYNSLGKFHFKKDEAIQLTQTLSQRYEMSVDPLTPIRSLSVGLKQRVEILKALSIDAKILILDEPTAVLSPQEVNSFFHILQALRDDNKAIIFISHKMKEVLEISDSITVLRQGRKVYHGKTGELSSRELAKEMLGEEIKQVKKNVNPATEDVVLTISQLTVEGNRKEDAVRNVSLETYRGEIVGIAGVDGNGQLELAEAIMGLRPIKRGFVNVLDMQPSGIKNIRRCGVAYIPEDRRTTGIITTFSIAENLMLNISHLSDIARYGIINQKTKYRNAENLIDNYDIRPPKTNIHASTLSGGNQQKVVIARELSTLPELTVAVNPTRGLDISAAQYVQQNLIQQSEEGKSVLLISTELEEVIQLSDRLYVMSRGKLIDATQHRDNIEALGMLMMGENDSYEI